MINILSCWVCDSTHLGKLFAQNRQGFLLFLIRSGPNEKEIETIQCAKDPLAHHIADAAKRALF